MEKVWWIIKKIVFLVEKYSADLLLAGMFFATILLPFRDPIFGDHEYHSPVNLLIIAVLLLAVARKQKDTAMTWLLLVIFVFRLVMLVGLYSPYSLERIGEEGIVMVRAGMAVAFLGSMILLLTNHLWASRIGAEDSIKIAGALYLMIGVEFGNLHSMVYILDNNSYHVSSALIAENESEHFYKNYSSLFIYYSFSTLTTMGMGDILPISRVARTLTWFQGITGQMFMVVLMAKVINLHSRPHPVSKTGV